MYTPERQKQQRSEAAGGNATELLGHSSRKVTRQSYLDPRITGPPAAVDLLFRLPVVRRHKERASVRRQRRTTVQGMRGLAAQPLRPILRRVRRDPLALADLQHVLARHAEPGRELGVTHRAQKFWHLYT